MAFNPNLPAANSLIQSAELRAQFNGLKQLIDNVPAGPQGTQGIQGVQGVPGPQGEQGPPFAGIIVDGVTTLPPGEAATVTANLQDNSVHLTFGVPSGANGSDGAAGLPFATVEVVGVTTLPAGSDATVTAVLSGDVVHLSFGLPRGTDGTNGSNGADGSNGANGSDGAPGEVTAAQLSTEIAGTAQNPTSIAPFPGSFSDPVTQAEMLAYVAWGETLRAALVR